MKNSENEEAKIVEKIHPERGNSVPEAAALEDSKNPKNGDPQGERILKG
jgi:hypothetical protein